MKNSKDRLDSELAWRSYLDSDDLENQSGQDAEEKIVWEFKCLQKTVPTTVLHKIVKETLYTDGYKDDMHVPLANFDIPAWTNMNLEEYFSKYFTGEDKVDFLCKRFGFFKDQINR